MPRLSALIPTQFARECATAGFIESCKQPLRELIEAPDGAAAASILAGAAGGPAAFIVAYAGVSLVQWRLGRRDKRVVAKRFERMQESLDRIEKELRDSREMQEIERELDALFASDAGLRDRFEDVEVRSNEEAQEAAASAVREVLEQLGIEKSFDHVRIYLSNLSDWVLEVRETTRSIDRKQDAQLENQDELMRLVRQIDQRQKAAGEQAPPLSEEDQRILAEARAHGDAKSRAQAAIMQHDFAAADPLIEAVTQRAASELFDALTLKGDRHYYAGEFDAAIEPYEKALELRPDDVAARNNAAIAHARARLDSLEAHRKRSIEIHLGTLDRVPHGSDEWAMTQNNLGGAYAELPTGDHAANLAKAIEAFEAALTVRTREAHPADWATTQSNLGGAYVYLPTGDRAANLAKAIEAIEAALTVHTRGALQVEWAGTMNNLGVAYASLPTGDRVSNLSKAAEAFKAAMTVYTIEAHPANWAMTQYNLGKVYMDLPTGDRAANLAEAIGAYDAALTVHTREAHPGNWAMTQNNVGHALAALADIPGRDRCDLLRRAISASKGALTVWTREAFPHDHARISRNLAIFRKAFESAGGAPPFDDIPPAE